MLKQLLLCKRLFNEGMTFAKRSDPISNGIAISLFQDSVIRRIPELRDIRAFAYLTEYLENSREITVASLLQLPLQDYIFLRETLPSAFQYGDGRWQTTSKPFSSYDDKICKRAIDCLVNIAIRLENII
jgi:hypothetical protein